MCEREKERVSVCERERDCVCVSAVCVYIPIMYILFT